MTQYTKALFILTFTDAGNSINRMLIFCMHSVFYLFFHYIYIYIYIYIMMHTHTKRYVGSYAVHVAMWPGVHFYTII